MKKRGSVQKTLWCWEIWPDTQLPPADLPHIFTCTPLCYATSSDKVGWCKEGIWHHSHRSYGMYIYTSAYCWHFAYTASYDWIWPCIHSSHSVIYQYLHSQLTNNIYIWCTQNNKQHIIMWWPRMSDDNHNSFFQLHFDPDEILTESKRASIQCNTVQ